MWKSTMSAAHSAEFTRRMHLTYFSVVLNLATMVGITVLVKHSGCIPGHFKRPFPSTLLLQS